MKPHNPEVARDADLIRRDAEPYLESWFNDYVRRHGQDPSAREFNRAARRIYNDFTKMHLELRAARVRARGIAK